MSRAVVNVAFGGPFLAGQDRLIASLDEHAPSVSRVFYRDTLPPGSPSHKEKPYAFKTSSLLDAKRNG